MIRFVALTNLFLFVVFVVPVTNHLVEGWFRNLEDLGLAAMVGSAIQAWVVVSTLFATGLLVWRLVRKCRSGPKGSPESDGMALDAVLLLAWWIALLGVCMYAFMLGMAG